MIIINLTIKVSATVTLENFQSIQLTFQSSPFLRKKLNITPPAQKKERGMP